MGFFKILKYGENAHQAKAFHLNLQNKASVIFMATSGLMSSNYNIKETFEEYNITTAEKKEFVYQIIINLGPDVPTTLKYPDYKKFRNTIKLVPTGKKVYEDPSYQKAWTIAYKWAQNYEYKNSNQSLIDSNQNIVNAIKNSNNSKTSGEQDNKKLKELETRIKNLERKFAEYENQ